MDKVRNSNEFSVDFKDYRSIDRNLKKQCEKVVDKINSILRIFRPILSRKSGSAWEDFRVRLYWFLRDRKELGLLCTNLDLLTRYMDIFIALVNLDITQQGFEGTESDAIKLQIETQQEQIATLLKIVRNIEKNQAVASPTPDKLQTEIRHEMRRIFKKTVAEMERGKSESGSSQGSSQSSSSPKPPPSSPPTISSRRTPSPGGCTDTIHLSDNKTETLDTMAFLNDVRLNWRDSFPVSGSGVSYVSFADEPFREQSTAPISPSSGTIDQKGELCLAHRNPNTADLAHEHQTPV
ncbi:hypothetical protein BJY01DRAFT_247947 [Aspergillus pseudoustus]|uniref:Uncharacterized protein n=1 Tax=Aspergillus pseudoustus TaxID=1810923 RepID=A0ABR4JYZ8_9EURO